MTQAVSAIDRRVGSAALRNHIVRHLAFWIEPMLRTVVRSWIVRRDERLLQAMPEHELKDIGIARSEIRHAVRSGREGLDGR